MTGINPALWTELASRIDVWRQHPPQMVRDLFGVEPDPWQIDVLDAFPHQPRIAMLACTGPGKTATLAWIAWNFLLTRPHPIIGVTSISGDNLKSGLWYQLAYWRTKSKLLEALFEQTKTSIVAREAPETWKLEARTWAKDANPEQIGKALRGLHGPYVLWLLDETGDYPPAILPTVEAIFSGEPVEAHVVQAGNPINRQGPLYHAHTHRGLWHVVQITSDPADPKRTPRVSVEHAQAQIDQFGRDNPWVLINIFGQFPPSSMNTLIGPDEVEAAMKRYYRDWDIGNAPRVMGIDVARYGDDASVIFKRQGIQAFKMTKQRNIDSNQGAAIVNREWEAFNADAAFIDDTGGFGSGWIDNLSRLGRVPIGVHFAGRAHAHGRYENKRAEMYFDAIEWIKRGGALPESRELLRALTETTYTSEKDKLIIEPKDMIKVRLGYSPDEADAFVLTFAEPVQPKGSNSQAARPPVAKSYDPFAEFETMRGSSRDSRDYDPFGSM